MKYLNVEETKRAFEEEYIREDHYDGNNGIYRFAANITMFSNKKIIIPDDDEATMRNIQELKLKLESLEIPPSAIFIYRHTDSIAIDWWANGYQVVSSKEEYLKISLEFSEYIDKLTFADFEINTGMYCDDPFYTSGDEQKVYKNYNTRFILENFGSSGEKIEVISLRDGIRLW